MQNIPTSTPIAVAQGKPCAPRAGLQTNTIKTSGSQQAPSALQVKNTAGVTAALVVEPATDVLANLAQFQDVLILIRNHRDVKLLVDVETTLRLISYSPGRIEFEPTENAPKDLAQRLGSRLQTWTGNRWAVSIGSNGAKTIAEMRDAATTALTQIAKSHPLVQAVLIAFPKAEITEIRTAKDIATEAQIEALPEVEDEWDPFDEE